MDNLIFSDHSKKQQNIEYFVHLIRIAKADNTMNNSELELLHKIGRKFGFTEPEIYNYIETTGKSDYIPPIEFFERFKQVYEIIKMTLVDGVIDKNEMLMASGFATKSGFTEGEIPNLLVFLIQGIREDQDEDELFEVYKQIKKRN